LVWTLWPDTARVRSLALVEGQMPRVYGVEATRRLREAERATGWHLPIVAMTA
jgi:CheY-like chemotaxis protein